GARTPRPPPPPPPGPRGGRFPLVTTFGRFAGRNIRGGLSLWLRLATVLEPMADAHYRGMDAGFNLEAPSRDGLLGLATVCALVACATISGMRPTVLIVDDHAAFRASARALLQAEGFDLAAGGGGGPGGSPR